MKQWERDIATGDWWLRIAPVGCVARINKKDGFWVGTVYGSNCHFGYRKRLSTAKHEVEQHLREMLLKSVQELAQ